MVYHYRLLGIIASMGVGPGAGFGVELGNLAVVGDIVVDCALLLERLAATTAMINPTTAAQNPY